jgi:FixJ family two-component response regulator
MPDKFYCTLGVVRGAFYPGVSHYDRIHRITAGLKGRKLHQVPVISIVDDDESVREATKSLVLALGYKAMTFGSAEEFLGSAYLKSTACLITDVQMPGLSGVELQDRLIADGHSVPVIFVTGFPDETLQRRVLKSGAIGYLHKPCNGDRLIACIDEALASNQGRVAL